MTILSGLETNMDLMDELDPMDEEYVPLVGDWADFFPSDSDHRLHLEDTLRIHWKTKVIKILSTYAFDSVFFLLLIFFNLLLRSSSLDFRVHGMPMYAAASLWDWKQASASAGD